MLYCPGRLVVAVEMAVVCVKNLKAGEMHNESEFGVVAYKQLELKGNRGAEVDGESGMGRCDLIDVAVVADLVVEVEMASRRVLDNRPDLEDQREAMVALDMLESHDAPVVCKPYTRDTSLC
jgi:hypothetical protein